MPSWVEIVNQYKSVGVFDSAKTFSDSECIVINKSKKAIVHVNAQTKTHIKFDELISSYDQVSTLPVLQHLFVYVDR